jgi:hypothetical protein
VKAIKYLKHKHIVKAIKYLKHKYIMKTISRKPMDHCESFLIVGLSHIISIYKQKRMSIGECMNEERGEEKSFER